MSPINTHARPMYVYRPDANHFAGLGATADDALMQLYDLDTFQQSSYAPIEFYDFTDNPPEEGDFPSLSNYWRMPLVSARAWETLRPLIGYCCEVLPIICPFADEYFILHVMDTIDCLNRAKSDVRISEIDDRVMQVYKYAFEWPLLDGKHIFKLPIESAGEMIVDQEFRDVVQKNKLRGLVFRELSLA